MIDERTRGRIEGLRMVLEYCRNVEIIGSKTNHQLTPEEDEWWNRNVGDAPGLFYFDSPEEAEEVIEWMIEREAMRDD